MGSDLGPDEVVRGVADALQETQAEVILVGQEDLIRGILQKTSWPSGAGVTVVHAPEVIGMDEKPVISLRKKKDSSLVRALELVKNHEADAILSCGNTGSLMAGSTLKLRPREGVERPALATIIPTLINYIVMLDVGANPNTTPVQMVHNAVLGSDYCQKVLNYQHPRVGLLTIGTEEGKGNELVHSAHEKLKKVGHLINYTGLIEGFQIFEDKVDVVVCDGFVGNILLKTLESLVINLKKYIKGELTKNPLRLLGAFFAKGAFSALKNRLNPENYGAASLLGLNGTVLKSHGSSNRHSICSAVKMALSISGQCVEKDELSSLLEEINACIE